MAAYKESETKAKRKWKNINVNNYLIAIQTIPDRLRLQWLLML